jgi:hypothetical protein
MMRNFIWLCCVAALLLCQGSYAQTQPPPLAPGAQPHGPQTPVQQYQVQDGGTREILESIVVPPKAKAPFSLVLQTEWVKTLPDGGTITTENQRRIARDSEGRIYEERWFLVPKNGKIKSGMTTIQISDPHAHTLYNCFMLEPVHQCILSAYSPSTDAVYNFQGGKTGPLADDAGSVVHEDLGKQLISGLEAEGTRDSVIYNPDVFGNNRKVTIEREFWYSPKLGFNLISKRSDPRIGTQTFTVTNLILSEPDPKLFELPEGYKVVDRRESSPPQN